VPFALVLHEQRLPAARDLGDIGSLAHALYRIAGLRLERGDHKGTDGLKDIRGALTEAFDLSRQLGRPNSIGAIGTLLARVMALEAAFDEAQGVLDYAQAAFETLDSADELSEVQRQRQAINDMRGETSD
jgi:hypothetical protein